MDFISETKFNAPIKGCLPSSAGNGKGDLRIDSNLALEGNLCEEGSFSITNGDICVNHGIFVGTKMCNVTIGGFKGCGTDYGRVKGQTADFKYGNFGNLNIGILGDCGGGSACGCKQAMIRLGSASEFHGNICVFNELAVYDQIRFVMSEGSGNYDTCYWTLDNNTGELRFMTNGGSKHGGNGMRIFSDNQGVFIDDLRIEGDGCEEASITLGNEKITSWSDLKQYVGGNENKIQRFTSPALPADCSQFYFEGDETVTGTELPIIQVRETATGKLWQMDVWVNLDEACSGFTLGKPVAEVEPCSSVIEAGKWTAIVMS